MALSATHIASPYFEQSHEPHIARLCLGPYATFHFAVWRCFQSNSAPHRVAQDTARVKFWRKLQPSNLSQCLTPFVACIEIWRGICATFASPHSPDLFTHAAFGRLNDVFSTWMHVACAIARTRLVCILDNTEKNKHPLNRVHCFVKTVSSEHTDRDSLLILDRALSPLLLL